MKRRILLVDDELAILLTLKAILEIHGFEVETADSADHAIKKLQSAEYNMVITDLRMERETAGFDVIRFDLERLAEARERLVVLLVVEENHAFRDPHVGFRRLCRRRERHGGEEDRHCERQGERTGHPAYISQEGENVKN